MNRVSVSSVVRRRSFVSVAAAGLLALLAGVRPLRSIARQEELEGERATAGGKVRIRLHPLAIPRNKKGVDLNG